MATRSWSRRPPTQAGTVGRARQRPNKQTGQPPRPRPAEASPVAEVRRAKAPLFRTGLRVCATRGRSPGQRSRGSTRLGRRAEQGRRRLETGPWHRAATSMAASREALMAAASWWVVALRHSLTSRRLLPRAGSLSACPTPSPAPVLALVLALVLAGWPWCRWRSKSCPRAGAGRAGGRFAWRPSTPLRHATNGICVRWTEGRRQRPTQGRATQGAPRKGSAGGAPCEGWCVPCGGSSGAATTGF
mmetsp:Transcript_12030/g.28179  ORF Transcript_12030/g.28179 Transcript_12030/m.28179 type:complete len:245 (+) Transcript_12030:787-1521(+)